MYEILKTISSPDDVKKLNISQLNTLTGEIREALFNRLTKHGGHFGPNFGIVETEIAMHYVFSSPKDKFVFDVSHQSYPHKMLTGRWKGYIDDKCFDQDSGYTNPEESKHDLFNVGHTSTSISLATGLAKAVELNGGDEKVVALIGDGSLSGGEALEGLNVAGSEIKSNLIIIVNDNQQSISETHGGIYKNLKELRESGGKCENNIFRSFGLEYLYEENGNDIEKMINVLQKAKSQSKPVVVHINTQKGKGYSLAEQNKENWHWTMPFDRETGKPLFNFSGVSYTSIVSDFIMQKSKQDKKFVVVTPNMPSSVNLTPEKRQQLGNQFVDVGIAEEQAVAMSAGLAKAGMKPLVVTNTTFMQRSYDQISHDVCINSLPVTILLNYNNFDGLTDVSHLGIFGLSAFSNIPNLVVLSPSSKQDLQNCLDWALDQNEKPVMILMPGGSVLDDESKIDFNNLSYTEKIKGEKVAILALGDFYQKGEKLAKVVKENLGFTPTLINPIFASNIDTNLLEELKKNHRAIITLEDGILDGGFGEKIARFYSDSSVKVKCFGLEKKFYDRYDPQDLLEKLGITSENMLKTIKDMIN